MARSIGVVFKTRRVEKVEWKVGLLCLIGIVIKTALLSTYRIVSITIDVGEGCGHAREVERPRRDCVCPRRTNHGIAQIIDPDVGGSRVTARVAS